MTTDTKGLFASVLRARQADCVCDIGSRDGDQALLFRHLLPRATVLAFEANPINFQIMAANPVLTASRIERFPYAITNHAGRAQFHVTDVDYTDPREKVLMGTSSLLVHKGLKIKETVEVETHRLDAFILSRYPSVRRLGLWIDTEGAEYGVIEGVAQIKDRVVALHVETALTPMRIGQKTTAELLPLLASMGFVPCGSNIGPKDIWGDIVFLSEETIRALGWRWHWLRSKAMAVHSIHVDELAVLLKRRAPWLYRLLRRLYIKVGM